MMLSAACLLPALEPGDGNVRFLTLGDALSLAWLFDDLFMLHEEVLPRLTGMDQEAISEAYGATMGVWLLVHRRRPVRAAAVPLAAAVALFGLMAGVDLVVENMDTTSRVLLEDGAKLLGICARVTFALTSSLYAVWGALHAPPAPSEGAPSLARR